ncbi:MAG: ATP-binding protein [Verrucomicrobiota bacterium]
MKPLTTSVYTFSDLIAGGYLYVDKSAGIYELIREYKGQYFLSRPRRFGKSLLISTLKVIFQGRRDLFDGLEIADKDYDWQAYPVIHLDMGTAAARSATELEGILSDRLDACAYEYELELTNSNLASRFQQLIENLSKRDGKVVILIDEYDKPLLGHLGRESAREIQAVLKQFYAVVKTTEAHQRFVLITGVSKFSKVSIFSDLNNLTDLTMSRQAATLLGYTQEEVEANFPDYIERLARTMNTSVAETLDELRVWYNGYKFHQDAPTVYNPVSLMKCFINEEFKNYWFETGTPTFLLELLKRKPVDLGDLTAPEDAFSVYEPDQLHSLPLLFQTGYLTIKGSVRQGRRRQYRLGFPNFEIEESLSMAVASTFANLEMQEADSALTRIVQALQTGDIDAMFEHLKTFFHNVPYDIVEQKEKYYQVIFFTVFKLIGAMIDAEVKTSLGRIDAVVRTAERVFIFEFKLRGTAAEAMQQIKDKQYAAGYRDDPREVVLVGVEFDWENRNIGDWLVESP